MSTKMQQQVACNATPQTVTFFATLSNKNTQLKELGSWVKQHREKANLSQETAADKAGLSRFQWLRIENGQSGTKRETLIQIAKVINADVNQTLRKGGFVSSTVEAVNNLQFQPPDWLLEIDFSIFDEEEIEEIRDFIRFKEQQKIDEYIFSKLENNEDLFSVEINDSLFQNLLESDSNSVKLRVMKNLMSSKNLTEETAKALFELFCNAYDSAKEALSQGKELATESKKKIPFRHGSLADRIEKKVS